MLDVFLWIDKLLSVDVLSRLGAITGTIGCLLGILNFRRDKAKVTVKLAWDMEPYDVISSDLGENKLYCCITVTNEGRRPVFISHVAIKRPGKDKYLLLVKGVKGKTLREGDPPEKYVIPQDRLGQYSKEWRKLRGYVENSSGRRYYSKPVSERPSWVREESNLEILEDLPSFEPFLDLV